MDVNQPVAVAGLTFYGDASGKDDTEGLAVGGRAGKNSSMNGRQYLTLMASSTSA